MRNFDDNLNNIFFCEPTDIFQFYFNIMASCSSCHVSSMSISHTFKTYNKYVEFEKSFSLLGKYHNTCSRIMFWIFLLYQNRLVYSQSKTSSNFSRIFLFMSINNSSIFINTITIRFKCVFLA
jgi:hypothetical protein